MSDLTFESATDVLLDHFKTTWDGSVSKMLGYHPDAEYPGTVVKAPKSRYKDLVWARVSLRHTGAGQKTFGGAGNRRFGRKGILSVQLFTPKADRGLTTGQRLGMVMHDAFEGQRLDDHVTIQSTVTREGGNTDAHFDLTIVTVGFEYDVHR